jgi:beta-lactamase class A
MDRTTTTDLIQAIADRCSGSLSVFARHLDTGEEVALAPDEILPTASVIKLPILVELYRAAAAGELSLDDRVTLRDTDAVGGSGILKVLGVGLQPTLRDLATLMIALSDNTATNLVLDALGELDGVNATMDALGFPTIQLHNRIDFERIGGDVRKLGESSTRDMCGLVEAVARGEVVSPEVSTTIEGVLETQQYLDQGPRYVLAMPYWRELGQDPIIRYAGKTGFFTGTRVDTGIVRFVGGGGFTYAVANHGLADETFLPESEGSVVNGLVGKALVEHWWPADQGPAPTVTTPYGGQ